MRKYTGKSRMCPGKKMGTSRSPRHQLRVQQGCYLPFISRIYSRRSYMGRCSLPISLRRPFVPPPLCTSNKHSDQENRLSPARNEIGWYYARRYAIIRWMHRVRGFQVSISRSHVLPCARVTDPANATNGKRRTATGDPVIKSPTNDKQISHSGSPIYRFRNTLLHT